MAGRIQLSLSLFGSFQAKINGQIVAELTDDKSQIMLAYLALESEHPHKREDLSQLFWPHFEANEALQALNETLAYVRAVLSLVAEGQDIICSSPRAVQLNPAVTVITDVWEFERIITNLGGIDKLADPPSLAAVLQLQQALSLYKGAFLEHAYLREHLYLSEWLLIRQEKLYAQASLILEQLASYFQAQDAYPQALGYARRQIELDPCRETTHRRLMTILLRLGDYNGVIGQYRECEAVLQRIFGVRPHKSTRELYEEAVARKQETPISDIHSSSDEFIGRTVELEHLNLLLSESSVRLISVVGMGGVGKTRLIQEALPTQEANFQDGVFVVPCEAVPAGRLAVAIATALHLSIISNSTAPAQLVQYLQQRDVLLILDHVTYLTAADRNLFERLIRETQHAKILVTTRTTLNIPAEWSLPLDGLPIPPSGTRPDQAAQFDSVQLFFQSSNRSTDIQPISLATASTAEIRAIMSITQLVNGNPLIIELLAGARSLISIVDLDKMLDIHLNDPTLAQTSKSAIFATTIDIIWKLLPDKDKETLKRLASIDGSFDVTIGSVVAGVDLAQLQAFVNRAFLDSTRSDHRRELRFNMPARVRHFVVKRHSNALTTGWESAPAPYWPTVPQLQQPIG